MPALRPEVLIIGHPKPETIAIGASFAASISQAQNMIARHRYSVIALATEGDAPQNVIGFLDHLNKDPKHLETLRILVHDPRSPIPLARFINRGRIIRVLKDFSHPELEAALGEAIEQVRLSHQNEQLVALIREQNQTLEKLTIELEDRVEKRQSYLLNARQRLVDSSQRLSALHRALVAMHRAASIVEMERLLGEALVPTLRLSWIRIELSPTAQSPPHTRHYSLFSTEIGSEREGRMDFARDLSEPFRKDEKSFLLQISDAVSLAIDRLAKLELLEALKGQWQSTFDSISHPLSLIDAGHVILRTNKAFTEKAAQPNVLGRKCYEVLFARDTPCDSCHLGRSFQLRTPSQSVYQVSSQKLRFKRSEQDMFVVLYRDVTDQQRLERQILESAKMAELGTIGSSIAHEINNPLGGIISYLQLMKMELQGDEEFFQDLDEMEQGAKRCADIVRSLLGFSRQTHNAAEIDLRDVVRQALKISQLQTHWLGLKPNVELPERPCLFRGHANPLTQMICTLLQFLMQSPAQSLSVELQLHDDRYQLILMSEALPLANALTHPAVDLAVAKKIANDHQAQLEISADPGRKTVATISFPRPVF